MPTEEKIGPVTLVANTSPAYYKFEGIIFGEAENRSRCVVWRGKKEYRTHTEALADATAALEGIVLRMALDAVKLLTPEGKQEVLRALLGEAGNVGTCAGCEYLIHHLPDDLGRWMYHKPGSGCPDKAVRVADLLGAA